MFNTVYLCFDVKIITAICTNWCWGKRQCSCLDLDKFFPPGNNLQCKEPPSIKKAQACCNEDDFCNTRVRPLLLSSEELGEFGLIQDDVVEQGNVWHLLTARH